MTTPHSSHNGRIISREHLHQMIDRKVKFTLIDLRAPENYGEFHIPSAINIPLNDQFETDVALAMPDKDGKIVVYCADKTCAASAKATKKLLALGYTRVRDFEDGKQGWREAPPMPVVVDASPSPAPGVARRRAVPTIRPAAAPVPSAT